MAIFYGIPFVLAILTGGGIGYIEKKTSDCKCNCPSHCDCDCPPLGDCSECTCPSLEDCECSCPSLDDCEICTACECDPLNCDCECDTPSCADCDPNQCNCSTPNCDKCPDVWKKGFDMYAKKDCKGRDELGHLGAMTFEECSNKCGDDETCTSFQYRRSITGCYLSTSCTPSFARDNSSFDLFVKKRDYLAETFPMKKRSWKIGWE